MRKSHLQTISTFLIATFPIGITLLHIYRPEFSPVRDFMSKFGINFFEKGWIFTLILSCLATGSLAQAFLLSKLATASRRTITFLTVWGICGYFAAFFPTDPDGAMQTIAGLIHGVAATASFVAITLYSFSITKDLGLNKLIAPTITLLLILNTTSPDKYNGLFQRLFVGAVVALLLWVNVKIQSNKMDGH